MTTHPTELEASSRVSQESAFTLRQLECAFQDVHSFNSLNPYHSRDDGFACLEKNLEDCIAMMHRVQEWHVSKHEKALDDPAEEKKLFLAEISILLIMPYVHRLLTTDERMEHQVLGSGMEKGRRGLSFQSIDPMYATRYTATDERMEHGVLGSGIEKGRRGLSFQSVDPTYATRYTATDERMEHGVLGSGTEGGRRELSFQSIDPMYATRYTGVCLASVMRSAWRDREFGCAGWTVGGKVSRRLGGVARILASKFFGLITCLEMILTLGAREEDDLILEKAVGHKSHLEVDGIVEKALLYDRATAERNLDNFTALVLTANAVVNEGFYYKYLPTRLAAYALAASWIPFNRSEARLRGELCYAGSRAELLPKLRFARFIWNLPETPLVKSFYRMGLERVKVDHEFFIPPWPETTTPMVGGSDPIFARIISNRKMKILPKTTSKKKATSFDWLKARDHAVDETPFPSLRRPLLEIERDPTLIPGRDALEGEDVLLIHFHGGGFVALSSFSHENYTRIWARNMPGITILSIDYRLAPDYPFPYAFNDAYRAYRWAVETCHTSLGFTPRKIILTGDSAGGNLAGAVCVRAIEDEYRAPDGLLLIYPALDLRRSFSPSLCWTLNDRLIPFVFLECCMAAYLGDSKTAAKTALDTRCSPAVAQDSVLRKMPKTRIVVGDGDPLFDQSIRFAHHLARLGVDVKAKIYEAMPHGFCSFIWPIVGVPEVRICIDDTTELLKDLARNNELGLAF